MAPIQCFSFDLELKNDEAIVTYTPSTGQFTDKVNSSVSCWDNIQWTNLPKYSSTKMAYRHENGVAEPLNSLGSKGKIISWEPLNITSELFCILRSMHFKTVAFKNLLCLLLSAVVST